MKIAPKGPTEEERFEELLVELGVEVEITTADYPETSRIYWVLETGLWFDNDTGRFEGLADEHRDTWVERLNEAD